MRLASLILGLIVLTILPLLFLFSMTWVIESGAQLATVLTNNTQSQYYYFNAFNQYAPGYEYFTWVFALLLIMFITVLLLCLRDVRIER